MEKNKGDRDFKQSQLSPKNVFGASTGFEPMASAFNLALRCSVRFHSFHGYDNINSAKWPASNVWVFIAQLVEHCSANAETMDSNPVEAPKTFFGFNYDCLNRKRNCDDHTFISKMFPIKKKKNYIGMKKIRFVPLNILMPNFVTFLVFEGVALSTKALIFASVN